MTGCHLISDKFFKKTYGFQLLSITTLPDINRTRQHAEDYLHGMRVNILSHSDKRLKHVRKI
ncbi:hypothetical protein ETA_30020 [Erwinia tasmaniensis Et1/99]|uniref:Uncharacterized protein n=1 Tax=Erwinia tasmaniensis (strain DSM 17950 / CFBP 7177 / CIP 109463 / NCPPB 4357 / Et1/99) TaxID=465817 RepID=B2VCU3_ERWT9|nr:hypothetical protein ETA_30020 [Erwinia tasmaniensis Et1/99]